MGMEVCSWHCWPTWWFGDSIGLRFLSDSSLDLKGTMDSWLTLGMAASSNNEERLSWLVNSTKAYMPWKTKTSTHNFIIQLDPSRTAKLVMCRS